VKNTTTNQAWLIGAMFISALAPACANDAGVGNPPGPGLPDASTRIDTGPDASPVGTISLTVTAVATATSHATGVATATGGSTGGTTQASTPTGGSTLTVSKTITITSTSTSTAGVVVTVSAQGSYNQVTITYPPAWSCPSDTSLPANNPSSGTEALPTDPSLSATDCASLANLRRPELKAQSLSALTSTRAGLIGANCYSTTETRCLDSNGQEVASYNCYRYYSTGGSGYGYGGVPATGGATASVSAASGGAAGSSGATDYSTTNTQVASVDEADYVKNDSNTIFVLSTDGLHVINAWPAAGTHEIAHLTLTGEPRRCRGPRCTPRMRSGASQHSRPTSRSGPVRPEPPDWSRQRQ